MEKRKYMLIVLAIGIIFCIGIASRPAPAIIIEIPQMQSKEAVKNIVPFGEAWQTLFAKIPTLNRDQQIAICSHILHFIDPNFIPAYMARGDAYFAEGEYCQAIEDYSSAIALQLESADVYYKRALAKNFIREITIAIRDLDKALAIDPNKAAAYYERAYSRYLIPLKDAKLTLKFTQDTEKAAALDKKYRYTNYRDLSKTRHEKAWLESGGKAINCCQSEMYRQALENFKRVPLDSMVNPHPDFMKKFISQDGMNEADGMRRYRWFFVDMMKASVKAGDFGRANLIANVRLITISDREAYTKLLTWGNPPYVAVKRREWFDESRQKNLQHSPQLVAGHFSIGDDYTIVHSNAQNPLAVYHQSLLSYFAPVDGTYEDLVKLDPEAMAQLYAWQSYDCAALNKTAKFDETRRMALELAPNSPTVSWIIGDIYSMRGDTKTAIAYYEKSLSLLTPADARCIKVSCALARAYKKSGNMAEASALYQKIINAQPALPDEFDPNNTIANLENAPLYLCYGEAYDDAGDHDKAKYYYHIAIAVNRELKDQVPETYHPTYTEELPYLPVVSVDLDERNAVLLPGRSSIEPIYSMPVNMYEE